MAGKESTPKRFSAPAYYLHAVVCLLIMFGFGQLPPVEPLTPLGMNLIGIFLGVLYGWVCIEIVWPSLAGLLALMLIGGMKPMMLLNKSFGDPVVQMMFFIFVFCATISHYGLSKFISLWFITRKFVAGRPWVFTYTFLGSIFILGGLTSASPAAIIGWVQKIILAFLFLLVILLLAPNFMPRDFFLTRFLKGIGNTGIVILLVTVMAAIKVEGKALLNFKVMVDSGVTWGIVLLLAFVQPLSGAMARPESGITPFLMMALDPIISGGTPLTFALFLGLAATLLTQVMNNGAVGVALMPIIYSYCQAAGVSPELPLIMVVMGVHFAFLTPAASASAALLHGNEWSDSKAIWKTAPAVILMSYLVTAAITIIVGKAIF